jgi:hypothetical protein
MSDAVYVNRKYTLDATRIPLDHYSVWLQVLGRTEAYRIIAKLSERIQKFYKQYRGKNKYDGSFTSRKAAVKVFAQVASYIPKFREAVESPFNVDALLAG